MIGKVCADCSQTKPFDDFPPAEKRRDGRGTYCKVCMRKRSADSYRRRAAAAGRTVRDRLDVPGLRRCPDCEQVLPLEAFPRNRSDPTGRGGYCLPCHNSRSRENRQRLHGSTRAFHLKRRYGLTAEDVDDVVEMQGGTCLICRSRAPQHVDHDHETGLVRGVLCSGCNQGLGNFRDDTALLRAAAFYLDFSLVRHARETH